VARATGDVEVAAVRATVLDYFEGWYDADPERMARAVHPDLAKRSRPRDAAQTRSIGTTTAARMIALTAAGEGIPDGAVDRRIDIDVVDVSTDVASVVVRSVVYDEYLQLILTPEGWRIINALWRYSDGHVPVG
jgi:hypothetical protein